MLNRLVLMSGGMDSSMLLASEVEMLRQAKQRDGVSWKLAAAFFNYGQANYEEELRASNAICELLRVPLYVYQLPDLVTGLTPGSVIPARNLIFASIGANIVCQWGGGQVLLGACAEDQEGFPDCRPQFIDHFNHTLLECKLDVELLAPLTHLSKAEAIHLRKTMPEASHILALSHSCYLGGDEPCGTCGACVKRIAAFQEAGMDDPAT